MIDCRRGALQNTINRSELKNYRCYELVKNRKMTGADILRRLKDEFNIKDISA